MTLGAGQRKVALAVHLAVSVGWVGAVAAYLALDITTVVRDDPEALRAAYHGMDLIAGSVIVPLAFASLTTGVVVSLGTRWGLFRHYWVVISLVLTMVAAIVLVAETRTIAHLASVAADPTTSLEGLRRLPSTLPHSVGGLVVLLVVLVLNVFKPQGLTRYGARRLLRQR